MENTIRVFITKYALTDGILETDAELCDNNDIIRVKKKDRHRFDQYFYGEDTAIQSAEKKILKLKNLQF